MLRRAASKATGISLPVIKRAFMALKTEYIALKDAEKAKNPSFRAAKEAERQRAIEEAKAAHEAERERLWRSCREANSLKAIDMAKALQDYRLPPEIALGPNPAFYRAGQN